MTSIPGSGLLRWAEVDVDALRHNATAVRARLATGTELLAMVKSNGYGHGAELAARAALDGGASWLGVYTPDEALALRAAGFSERMLVTGWSPPPTLDALIAADVDITVIDTESVTRAAEAARARGVRARVQVKVDTGLTRLGVRPEDVPDLVLRLRHESDALTVAGIFTHYADAERDPDFTRTQERRFLDAVKLLRPVGPHALLHACGSAGTLLFPDLHHDLVRAGITLYGYAPAGCPGQEDLRPAMSVFSRIAQVRTITAGESVGYGRTWRAEGPRRIATAAIGYGQGLSRHLSNRGSMVVRGVRCPIVGTVSMDQVALDVTDSPGVERGDVAMFFGTIGAARLGADEVAATLGTISYEVLCAVAASVPRLAVRGSDSGG